MTDERFDQLIDELRAEAVSDAEVAAAAERVRERLQNPVCAEFRSELAGYIAGTLLESRRMLVEDHLARCAGCRRALAELRGAATGRVVEMPGPRASVSGWIGRHARWAAAACLLGAAAYAGRGRIDSALAGAGPRATVESVRGQLLALSSGKALAPGAGIGEAEAVRTPAGSRAVLRLRDGSLVEINERSEVLVRAAWSGQRIHLERGDAIVQAAKQRRGHLVLTTRDSASSVKGTVFAVSTGVAGSVVSVVEGSVAVAQGAAPERVLKPGEQVATSDSLRAVGVRRAVSWSADAERYHSLLAEFANLEKQISEIMGGGVRTESRLLPRLLPGAMVYAAVPNAPGSIDRSVALIEQRARDNEAFRQWWESNAHLKTALQRLPAAAPLLGDEVAFVLANPDRGTIIPLVLAEAKPGREDALRAAMARVVEGIRNPPAHQVADGLLLISSGHAELLRARSYLGRGADSPFAAEIAQRYSRGAGWLWMVDIGTALGLDPNPNARSLAASLGLGAARYVALEQRGGGGRREDNEVAIGFQGARRGVAAWLAEPSAFGSQEYISSESMAAVAATTRSPRHAFEELSALVGGVDRRVAQVDVAADILAHLGSDFSVSLERVGAPMLGWVGAVEVYNPGALDAAIGHMIEAANNRREAADKIQLARETVDGRAWLSAGGYHWTHDRGYMVFGNDRALVQRSVSSRAAGTPLVRSAIFRQMQPLTPTVHNSGFVWLNTRGALGVLAAASGAPMPPGLRSLLDSRDPVLVVVNGETERIAAFSRTRLASLLVDVLLAAGGKKG